MSKNIQFNLLFSREIDSYKKIQEVGMKTHSVVKYHNQYMLKGESADNKKYFESV